MLTCTQDHPVYGVLVESEHTCRCTDTNAFGRVMDDLPDRLGRQMQAEHRAGSGRGKALAASAAVQQIAILVLSVLAADGDVALPSQAELFALLVGTEKLINISNSGQSFSGRSF